jgi:hypothetical protein
MAAAETYKWRDAEGKVHYSDQPPPASVKEATTVTPKKRSSHSAPAPQGDASPSDAKPAAAKPAADKPKTTQELDQEFKQRQVKAAEKAAEEKKKADEAAEKKQNCERARADVARLQDGGRLTRYNSKGEMEYMDDQQIAQELVRARKVADSWCK